MPTLQAQVSWTGPGGPGVSTFHFNDNLPVTDIPALDQAIEDFFIAVDDLLVNEVQVQGPSEFTVHDTVTGALIDAVPVSVPWILTGKDMGAYNRAAGLRVDWLTGAVVGGRRLRGRTFLVPAPLSAFTADGALTLTAATAAATAATALITDALNASAPLVVWSKTHGVMHDVTVPVIPALGAILRSRRD